MTTIVQVLCFGLMFLGTLPALATQYYLATADHGGKDSNNGTSISTPWLTPNHAVNCGDVIQAAANTSYSYSNFQNFGKVTCSAGNKVAWLTCATFDGCKIKVSASNAHGMVIANSYWGVQDWEVDGGKTTGICFFVFNYKGSAMTHHVVIANSIANGCGQGGFSASSYSSTAGVDYIAFVGDIAYGTSGGSYECTSGFNIYTPVNEDQSAGTHIYEAGNFAWNNVDGNPCDGGLPTDGQGFMFDTIDNFPYSGQMVVDNNIAFFNGGRGIEFLLSYTNNPNAKLYARHNTVYANNTQKTQNPSSQYLCGEIMLGEVYSTNVYSNLAATTAPTACYGGTKQYAYEINDVNSTTLVYSNYAYSSAGYNFGTAPGNSSPGFSFGPNNISGTNPSFNNPVDPGAPSCSTYSSVPACMARVISDFTPTNPAALAYGYQTPLTASVSDPLFPQWLCNVNLPTGMVTMGCS